MILKAENVIKRYYRKTNTSNYFTAVEKTDLSLGAGELTVLIGRSGSGKTTLLNMLAGLLKPTEGNVTVDGEDIYAMSDKALSLFRNKNIGVIPQGQTALANLTVLENVKLPYMLYNKNDGIDAYARELLDRVGMAGLADVSSGELSGGETRRMAIARALVMKPGLILADEPTGDLDDENTALVLGLLKELAAGGASVLMVTHETESVKYADRIYRMDAGVLKEERNIMTAAMDN